MANHRPAQSAARIAPAEPVDIAKAHASVVSDRTPVGDVSSGGVRRFVQESWQRSLHLHIDPDQLLFDVDLGDDELREYRSAHPLALALPTIRQLLIRHTVDAGLIVAVGDQSGRLLWIDGDRQLRRKAESMLFVEGADWSENRVGTSAPGTALALDRGIQIHGPEHFNRIVHPWSCTAVPVHDPATGMILGVIDITGGADAVGPATLPLIEATVAAVEAELRLLRLEELLAAERRPAPSAAATTRRPSLARRSAAAPLLRVLGSGSARLSGSGVSDTDAIGSDASRCLELSQRHAEILTLLAWHPNGLSAGRLAELLFGTDNSVVTVRAEMVRLRRVLEEAAPSLVPASKPYRLTRRPDVDAQQVLAFLDRGAHRVALGVYSGPLLPQSEAPGIGEIRAEVSSRLRDALLTDASAETLLDYARTDEAAFDAEVWRAALALLPPRSPKRAAVVARIELIDRTIGL
ncbi:transcriptional regulator [Leifsonia kafniensis]